jgi:hypothetical protein
MFGYPYFSVWSTDAKALGALKLDSQIMFDCPKTSVDTYPTFHFPTSRCSCPHDGATLCTILFKALNVLDYKNIDTESVIMRTT